MEYEPINWEWRRKKGRLTGTRGRPQGSSRYDEICKALLALPSGEHLQLDLADLREAKRVYSGAKAHIESAYGGRIYVTRANCKVSLSRKPVGIYRKTKVNNNEL